jgi:tRNA A-37 threonylcarbamoyl transferase component Bud32
MPDPVVFAGRYELRELIARGGMADVHRAFDRSLGREVAVKVFRGEIGEVRRFRDEIRMLATFEHPNLVQLLDAGEHEGLPFLVLSLVDGPTLARRLDEQGVLPPGEVTALAADVSRALAYIHAAGVVHRDVKPSNILLAPDGRALLGDFGVARLLESTSATQTGMVVGTARYLSPEQAAGEEVTTAADVYALGLVLFECLLGRAAFEGTQAEIAFARLQRDPDVPSDLPAPWPELLRSMTRRDPTQRPSAAHVLALTDSDPFATSVVVEPTRVLPTAAAPVRATRAPVVHVVSRDRRVLWGIAALVLLFIVGVALAARNRDGGVQDPTTQTTTIATTTIATTTAPDLCAQFDQQIQAVEAEKQRVQEQYKHDKKTRKELQAQLDEQQKQIEQRKQRAGC